MNYIPNFQGYQNPQLPQNPYQQFQQTQQMIPQQYQQNSNPQLDRLSELQMQAQMRDQMALNSQMQQMQNQGPKIIPVGSVEEAKGYLSPTTGEKVFFINNSNNEIYSKQLDFSTGKSNFQTFRLIPEQIDTTGQNSTIAVPSAVQDSSKKEIDMSKYVSKDDYESLKSEFNKFKKSFEEMWGEPTANKEEK